MLPPEIPTVTSIKVTEPAAGAQPVAVTLVGQESVGEIIKAIKSQHPKFQPENIKLQLNGKVLVRENLTEACSVEMIFSDEADVDGEATIQMKDESDVKVKVSETLNAVVEAYWEDESRNMKGRVMSYKIADQVLDMEADGDAMLCEIFQRLGIEEAENFIIVVEAAKRVERAPEDDFLMKVPCIGDAYFLKEMKKQKFLTSNQTKNILRFVGQNEESSSDNQHCIDILETLKDAQVDKLLTDFQQKHKKDTLKYLLSRAGKWTKLSETLMEKASDELIDEQICRFMAMQKNSFTNDENDSIFLDMFVKHQQTFLQETFHSLDDEQLVELFMKQISGSQITKLFTMLKNENVRIFWKLLSKSRRLKCFNAFDDDLILEFFVGDEYFDSNLKHRAWDNIGFEGRMNIWNLAGKAEEVVTQPTGVTQPTEVTQPTPRRESVKSPTKTEKKKNNLVDEVEERHIFEPKVQTTNKRPKLLKQLTTLQIIRFWLNLDYSEQNTLIKIVLSFSDMTMQFWDKIDYEKRCKMIDCMQNEELAKMFLEMDLENRTQTITMVNQKTREYLEQKLKDYKPKELQELFFYEHFTMKEKTNFKPQKFVENLVDDHYRKNNQVVPYEKIDDGYVQVIQNPYVQHGFITIQVVAPRLKTTNVTFAEGKDLFEVEFESDEAREAGILNKVNNDKYRLCENRYGQLVEESPSQARNAEQMGIISFFDYSERFGIYCVHSFFVSNPVVFGSADGHATTPEHCLFTGLNGDVFLFSERTKSHTYGKLGDLQLLILKRDQDPNLGEISREVFQNCYSFNISEKSRMAESIQNRKSRRCPLNIQPTIFEHNQRKYVAYSGGAETYIFFFDIQRNSEIIKIQGEALLSVNQSPKGEDNAKVTWLRGEKVLVRDIDFEVNGDEDIQLREISDSGAMITPVEDLKSHIDQLKKQHNLHVPLYVVPGHFFSDTYELNSFTLLFQHVIAFTFTLNSKHEASSDSQKYILKNVVEGASEIVKGIRDNTPKTYLLSYVQDEDLALMPTKADETEIETFTSSLFQITDSDQIARVNARTIKGKQYKFNLPISKNAIKSYQRNGTNSWRLISSPIILAGDKNIGAWMFKVPNDKCKPKSMIHFYESTIYTNEKLIAEPTKQESKIDYPLMSYKGFAPDNREIVLVNLADAKQPQKIINLINLQFICFIGHNHAERIAKIGFLALQDNEVCICWLTSQQPFRKSQMTDLSDYQIITNKINFKLPIRLSQIKKAEFIQEYAESVDEGALIVQTEDMIYCQDTSSGDYQKFSRVVTAPLLMQRGFNSNIYFVERSINMTDMTFNHCKLTRQGGEWILSKTEIFTVREGAILAIEIDMLNREQIDSSYTYNNVLCDKNPEATDRLYMMDDKENLLHFQQKESDNTFSFTTLDEFDLSTIKGFSTELIRYKQKAFNRIVVSDRCITINEQNFNLVNGHSWRISGHVMAAEASEFEIEDGVESGSDDDEEEKNRAHITIDAIKQISWTTRNLITCCVQQWDEKNGYQSQDKFVTKVSPSCRRLDLVGLKGLRDLESVNLIANDLYLFKLRSSNRSGTLDYWTVMDNFGQIHPLPKNAADYLIWSNFSTGQSRQKNSGCTLVLRGGQKTILSATAFRAYEEQVITSIEFSRFGEVIEIMTFNKDSYHTELTDIMCNELQTTENLLETKSVYNTISEYQAKKIASTLQYSDDVLCTQDGNLYRVASIVDKRFSDEVSINPRDNDEDVDAPDQLHMGLFTVVSNTNFQTSSHTKIRNTEQNLKVIVFCCKSESARFWLHKAALAVCGDFLCWSYPEETVVHTLDMAQINKIKTHISRINSMNKALQGTAKSVLNKMKTISSLVRKQKQDDDDNFVRADNTPINVQMKKTPTPKANPAQEPLLPAQSKQEPLQPKKKNMLINDSDDDQTDEDDGFLAINNRKSNRTSLAFEGGAPDKQIGPGPDSLNKTAATSEIQSDGDDKFERIDDAKIDRTRRMSTTSDFEVKLLTWVSMETRIIDLEVFAETESDSFKTILEEVPAAPQITLIENDDKQIRNNLLQVTVNDRIIIFDLLQNPPQEIFFLNASSQFIHPTKFVDPGIMISACFDDFSLDRDSVLFNQIKLNRSRDMCVIRQDRKVFNQKYRFDKTVRNFVCHGIFKLYSEVDLQEIDRIQQRVSLGQKIQNIDLDAALSTYEGHSMFSIFSGSVAVHEQLLSQFLEGEFEDIELEDETVLENDQLRRLYRILTMPTPDFPKDEKSSLRNQYEPEENKDPSPDQLGESLAENSSQLKEPVQQVTEVVEESATKSKPGLKSVLQKSLYLEQARIRACLMSIVNRCQECSVSNFCENQQDFSMVLSNLTAGALELIQDSFVNTVFTKKIETTVWHNSASLVTFRKNSSIITEMEIQKKIEEKLADEGFSKSEMTKSQVQVRMLPLNWLLSDPRQNFVDFVGILGDASSNQIYDTELISTLLEEFWNENYSKILSRALLPWVAYACSVLFFFSYTLKFNDEEEKEPGHRFVEFTVGLTCLVLLAYQLRIEAKQLSYMENKLDYFSSAIDLIDLYQFSSAIFIITVNLFNIPLLSNSNQRVMAAFTTLALWIKVLDWFKLFQPTSFFIRLISETIGDIKYFMLIFVVSLAMFGTPMYMLQLNRTADNAVVDEVFGGFWPLNLMYNQYMLSLGEFAMDFFDDEPQAILCYVFFLLATFFTQITMLNMLIAIMGDTFGRVIESKDRFSLQTKLEIMADYQSIIKEKNFGNADNEVYMFVVQPQMGDDDNMNAWEGNIAFIKKSVDKSIANLGKVLDKKVNTVLQQGIEAKSRESSNDQQSRSRYFRIINEIAELKKKQDANEDIMPNIKGEIAQVMQMLTKTHRVLNRSIQNSQEALEESLSAKQEAMKADIIKELTPKLQAAQAARRPQKALAAQESAEEPIDDAQVSDEPAQEGEAADVQGQDNDEDEM